jgi:cyclopropane-fatty-acyl-phospholipid synthase
MFAAFLSEDMTYSCPIWRSINDPKSASESLEEAQQRKLQYYICQAKIKASDHVLEIGTGWGSFAIAAVRTTGCKVTTITLSKEQKVLAEERIAAAGYADHIKVLLCDYRALPTPTGALYDKVVSIEMLEAVGREYLDVYFQCVHRLLKPHGGIAIFQSTTMHEARYEAYSKGEDFIRKYIFPGGHLPTVTQLVGSIERGSKGSLIVDGILNIGGHYPKALRAWRQNFEVNFYDQIRPALLDKHPDMSEKDIDLFRRKWEVRHSASRWGIGNHAHLGYSIISLTLRPALIPEPLGSLLSRSGAKGRWNCWKGSHSSSGEDRWRTEVLGAN